MGVSSFPQMLVENNVQPEIFMSTCNSACISVEGLKLNDNQTFCWSFHSEAEQVFFRLQFYQSKVLQIDLQASSVF